MNIMPAGAHPPDMDEGFTIYCAAGMARIVLTDSKGRKGVYELPVTEARKFFQAGVAATAPEPRTLGGLLWRRLRRS